MKTLSEVFFKEVLNEKNKITVDEYPKEDTNHSFNIEIDTKNVIVRAEGQVEFAFDVWEDGDYEVESITISIITCENDNGDEFELTDKQVNALEEDFDFEY